MAGYNMPPLQVESVSTVTDTGTVDLGTRVWKDGREYVYVYNTGSTAPVGYCVILTGTSGYTVNVTYNSVTTDNLRPTVFGVVREADLDATAYGWVVTRGHCDLYNDGTAAVAAGDMIIPSLNGKVKAVSSTSVITQLVFEGSNHMVATQATTTAGTFGAYVRLG